MIGFTLTSTTSGTAAKLHDAGAVPEPDPVEQAGSLAAKLLGLPLQPLLLGLPITKRVLIAVDHGPSPLPPPP